MLTVDAESALTNPEETGDTKTSIPPWTRSLYLPYPYGSLIVSAVQIHKLPLRCFKSEKRKRSFFEPLG